MYHTSGNPLTVKYFILKWWLCRLPQFQNLDVMVTSVQCKEEHPLPKRKTDGAAEDTVDERIDGTVQGWQVLDDHRGIETLLGVWEEIEIIQYVKEEIWTPAADEGWGRRESLPSQWAWTEVPYWLSMTGVPTRGFLGAWELSEMLELGMLCVSRDSEYTNMCTHLTGTFLKVSRFPAVYLCRKG